jgi:hypothetical protein
MSANEILKKSYTKYLTKSDEDIIQKTVEIASKVEEYINNRYNDYVKLYHGINKHKFKIKQELVGKTGFWIKAKKRYAQWIKNKEGVSKDYIEYKGLDVVRSDFPHSFVNLLTNVIENIMKNQPKSVIDNIIINFLDNIENLSIEEISQSKSVNKIEEYIIITNDWFDLYKSGTPSHVKGAINYNNLIDYYGYNDKYRYIQSKDKIKLIYLKDNQFGIDVIAYGNEQIPKKIYEFINDYKNCNKMFNSLLKNKLQSFYDAMDWGELPSHYNKISNNFFS